MSSSDQTSRSSPGADSPPGRADQKLDLGRSCLRLTRLEQVPSQLVRENVARYGVDAWITRYEATPA